MTAYSFQGLLVDVKSYNWHMSAPVDSALLGAATSIPVGMVVVPGGDAGSIDIADTDATNYLGIMNETRPLGTSTDKRSASYTWAGVVRVQLNTTNVLVGSYLKCGAAGVVALADKSNIADVTKSFGRSLEETTTDGAIIMAYINMAH